ncbi:MAG: hypothetical protein AAFX96_04650, partial [Pseudomonadota bacterium]
SLPLREQLAYALGLTSLHWGQDSAFRKVAKSQVSQDDMISELEKANIVTNSPRYPSGLSMHYCLSGDFQTAEARANSIRSEKPKYTVIKSRALTCTTAENPETHFDMPNPSE